MFRLLNVGIQRLAHAADLPLPAYATPGSSCADLRAAIPSMWTIEHGEQAIIPTGIRLSLPEGYEAQVRPRSGLSSKGIHGVFGTIDSDYQGEVKVILYNLSGEPFQIRRGDRVGQLALNRLDQFQWIEKELELEAATVRGANGFGHTGSD